MFPRSSLSISTISSIRCAFSDGMNTATVSMIVAEADLSRVTSANGLLIVVVPEPTILSGTCSLRHAATVVLVKSYPLDLCLGLLPRKAHRLCYGRSAPGCLPGWRAASNRGCCRWLGCKTTCCRSPASCPSFSSWAGYWRPGISSCASARFPADLYRGAETASRPSMGYAGSWPSASFSITRA